MFIFAAETTLPYPCPIRFVGDWDLGTSNAKKDYPMVMKMQKKTLPDGKNVCMPEE